jgi:hypothetical protein
MVHLPRACLEALVAIPRAANCFGLLLLHIKTFGQALYTFTQFLVGCCGIVTKATAELIYPFHDRDILVIACGRLCFHRKKANISTVLAGQRLGIKEVDDGIWLASFMLLPNAGMPRPNAGAEAAPNFAADQAMRCRRLVTLDRLVRGDASAWGTPSCPAKQRHPTWRTS